ncbi:DUF3596 domain-containing protein [Thalassotalea litorea]|uniref:DUF3596 domain-containing protein n=1 Tax=Thalassotalea litorea TaxID=2020715 RepID=A0A5R9ICW6_9GAMM|nr:site-specific integrase [Thalassotalea litorea]TLU61203.1 DUF3596 domain-containing protein [Thalassotalea litorea]
MGRSASSIKTDFPGVTVRAHKRSSTINLSFTYQGISCREPLPGLNPESATDLKAASHLLGEIKHQISIGQFHYVDYFPNGAQREKFGYGSSYQTLGDSLQRMLNIAQKEGKSNSSLTSYQVCARRLAPLQHVRLTHLEPASIQAFFLSLVERNLAAKTLSMTLSVLRIALDQAVIDKAITVNPLSGLKLSTLVKNHAHRLKKSVGAKADIKPFSKREMQAIVAHCTRPQFKHLVILGFFTGMRLEELIALRWQDVDLVEGVVHVRQARCLGQTKVPKTPAGVRTIALPNQAIEALNEQRQYTKLQNDLVFLNPRTNRPWDSRHGSIRRHWTIVLKNANVPYRYPYQMRHTFASNMIFAGADHLFIARQLGHNDLHSLYKTYGRQIDEYHQTQNRPVNAFLDTINI